MVSQCDKLAYCYFCYLTGSIAHYLFYSSTPKNKVAIQSIFAAASTQFYIALLNFIVTVDSNCPGILHHRSAIRSLDSD